MVVIITRRVFFRIKSFICSVQVKIAKNPIIIYVEMRKIGPNVFYQIKRSQCFEAWHKVLDNFEI